jgi:hypothetical protein
VSGGIGLGINSFGVAARTENSWLEGMMEDENGPGGALTPLVPGLTTQRVADDRS